MTGRARRYSVAAVRRARELRELGWSLDRIGDFICDEFGSKPTKNTVAVWTDPEAARRQAAHTARQNARRYTGRRAHVLHSPAARYARLVALREAGLGYRSVAVVLHLDYGDDFNEDQIRAAVRRGRYPKKGAAA